MLVHNFLVYLTLTTPHLINFMTDLYYYENYPKPYLNLVTLVYIQCVLELFQLSYLRKT